MLVLLEEEKAELPYAGCAVEQILWRTFSRGRRLGMRPSLFSLYCYQLGHRLRTFVVFSRARQLSQMEGPEEYRALLILPSKSSVRHVYVLTVSAIYQK